MNMGAPLTVSFLLSLGSACAVHVYGGVSLLQLTLSRNTLIDILRSRFPQ